jgi:hypothetical protein
MVEINQQTNSQNQSNQAFNQSQNQSNQAFNQQTPPKGLFKIPEHLLQLIP